MGILEYRESLIADTNPPIVDKDAPIATSFAPIADRNPPIDDKEPLIEKTATFRDFNLGWSLISFEKFNILILFIHFTPLYEPLTLPN